MVAWLISLTTATGSIFSDTQYYKPGLNLQSLYTYLAHFLSHTPHLRYSTPTSCIYGSTDNMTSTKFIEILEPTQAPTYTHPHLNVSLDDILKEGRERSASQSSESSQSQSHQSSGSTSPKSPTDESKSSSFRRRAFTLGSKKGHRTSAS